MNSGIACIAFLCIGITQAVAQQPSPDLCATRPRAAFDVISIKPSQASAGNFNMNRGPDGIVMTGSIQRLLPFAYNLRSFQFSGGPGWLSTAVWEIRAKTDSPDPDFSKLNDDQRQALWDKQMQEVQSMLIDRFHFQCHMESKEMPVYELVSAKSGSKLKPSTAEAIQRGGISSRNHAGIGHATGTGVGIDRIAIFLSGPTGRLIIDKTGLTGTFDFKLDWTQDSGAGSQAAPDTPGGPSIFTAVEEQLGLKLQPAKGHVPVMVIDHVDEPADN